LDQHAAAEAILYRCIERFPEFAPAAAQLAELLTQRGRPEEAANRWQLVLRDFPDQAEPWWFGSWSAALQSIGNGARREQVLQEMARRFPEAQATLVVQAQNAALNEQWERALALWTACLERCPDSTQPEWMNGKAMALFRLF